MRQAGRMPFFATRVFAHGAFAVIVWPMITVVGATFALADLPYYSLSPGGAIAASVAGTLLSLSDILVVGAIFFGVSGFVFSRLGVDTTGRPYGLARLGFEPALMFVACVTGGSIWYPAVLGQPIFFLLRAIPVGWVVALLVGAVVLGACFAGRPGKRVILAVALIVFGAVGPVLLAVRTGLESFIGRAPDLVILGVDSVAYGDTTVQFNNWVRERGGTWYAKAVAPGLLTNPVWTSILTMQPVRVHGVFHTFQHFPPGAATLISAARANGYRTVSVFPDQFTTAVGSKAGFDDDRSGPVGWRQLLLATVADNSLLLPLLKPALPRLWPSPSPWNHAGTYTYDVRREVRTILRTGSRAHRTLVAAHLTYAHIRAYPASADLSWAEIWNIIRSPAGTMRDRTFDWQDVDRPSDPVKLNAWKPRHLLRVIQAEVDASRHVENGRQLVVFSDHGNRTGLSIDTFDQERYYHVPLVTFGLQARCPQEPISLIDIGLLVGLAETRAEPSVEFTLAPVSDWPTLVRTARLRRNGDVDLDESLLSGIFKGLRRHDPWPGARTCSVHALDRAGDLR